MLKLSEDLRVADYLTRLRHELRDLSSADRLDVETEVGQHLSELVAAAIEAGFDHSEAVRVALRQLGEPKSFAPQVVVVVKGVRRWIKNRWVYNAVVSSLAYLVVALALYLPIFLLAHFAPGLFNAGVSLVALLLYGLLVVPIVQAFVQDRALGRNALKAFGAIMLVLTPLYLYASIQGRSHDLNPSYHVITAILSLLPTCGPVVFLALIAWVRHVRDKKAYVKHLEGRLAIFEASNHDDASGATCA